jgi:predicted transcriptional regulator
VIAKYTDGGIAVVKVGNKIYVGFEPSRTTLANLMMIQIAEKVKPEIPIVQVIVVGMVALLMLYSIIKELLFKILSKLFDFLSVLVVGVGGFINLHDKDAVLLNDLRRRIYEYILENPGVHLREIQRRFDVSLSSVTWHLKMLEKAGLIKSTKFRNKLVYFPTGMNKEDLLLMLTLDNDVAKSIVGYIAKVGEAHLRKIAKDLNLNVETVRYHLKRLERAGVLISREIDNKIVYTLNPEIFVK